MHISYNVRFAMTDKSYPPPCRNYLQPLYLSVTLYACAQREYAKRHSYITFKRLKIHPNGLFHYITLSSLAEELVTQRRNGTQDHPMTYLPYFS